MSKVNKFLRADRKARFTTTGEQSYEDFNCPMVTTTSPIICGLNVEGSSPVAIVKFDYQSTDTVRVWFSGNPGDDHDITISWN